MLPSKINLCLSDKGVIEEYVTVLTELGYTVCSIRTCDASALSDGFSVYKTPKALAKDALTEISNDEILMVSGKQGFVSALRYELLARMGF